MIVSLYPIIQQEEKMGILCCGAAGFYGDADRIQRRTDCPFRPIWLFLLLLLQE
jgi:hypothetical protein